ncbi:hypothetical protein EV2_009646 [Malus domestica]
MRCNPGHIPHSTSDQTSSQIAPGPPPPMKHYRSWPAEKFQYASPLSGLPLARLHFVSIARHIYVTLVYLLLDFISGLPLERLSY